MEQQSKLRCMFCNCNFPIWRDKGELREKNHIKDLWCANCEKVTKHVENESPINFQRVHTVGDKFRIREREIEIVGYRDADTYWIKNINDELSWVSGSNLKKKYSKIDL